MNCTIGWSCKGENGYACLSRAKKNCFSSLSQNHVTYIDWLKDQKNKNKAIVKPADKPEFKNNSKFPDNLDNLVVVKKLGGTTGAQLVKDPVTGKQYVMKNGSSPEHLENEAIADSAYQALGINVPNHKVYKDASGKPTKLAEYIEGRDRVFGTYFNSTDPGSDRTPFFDDNENEFLVMLEGIKSKHISSRAKKAILIKSQFVIWLIFLPLLLFPPNLF
jgi:hypothetical protein